jgi:hypothetical protein
MAKKIDSIKHNKGYVRPPMDEQTFVPEVY